MLPNDVTISGKNSVCDDLTTSNSDDTHTTVVKNVKYSGRVAEGIQGNSGKRSTEERSSEEFAPHQQLDQLTLELLMNKRQYRKYLEKTNPDEYEKRKEGYDRFMKYKGKTGHLMNELLNDYSVSGNSEHLGNVDIQDSFQHFLQNCIYFFETKDFENPRHLENHQEDDVLFLPKHIQSPEKPEKTRVNPATSSAVFSAPFANHYRPGNSFWGKNVSKQ
jgi:hypothetical protein